MASRNVAQAREAAALQTHEAALAEMYSIIEEHPVLAWVNRARMAVIPILGAARQGKSVLQVQPDCGACLRGEHAHSVFCRRNKKIKDRDKQVADKLKNRLNAIAYAAREALTQGQVPRVCFCVCVRVCLCSSVCLSKA